MRKKLLTTYLVIALILSAFAVSLSRFAVAQETHNIAVVSVYPSDVSLEMGELVNITVMVKNIGAEAETGIDVEAYYDTTTIEGTKTISTLGVGANASLVFTWNTTGLNPKTYIIKATASPVPDETDITDNTLVSTDRVRVYISPYIGVVPPSTVDPTLEIGKNYTVSIYTDYDGADVWGYEFTLTYNPTVLRGLVVTNGDLITKTKHDSAEFMAGQFDNVNGKLSVTSCSFQYEDSPVPVTSGPGILAHVTFEIVEIGDSNLKLGTETLTPTRLIGYNVTKENYNIIDDVTPDIGHILHGYFRNSVAEVIHDITVVSVDPSPTSVVEGSLVNITIVVENQGTMTETQIKVKVYYDNVAASWLIGTETVAILGAGANTSFVRVWNTTGVAEGNHTAIASATPVPGETDTEDNTLESEKMVTVRLLEERPLPLELIIGVVIGAGAVIAVVTYAVRRRKKSVAE